jgi:4-deoxy-L-threo-5-hexosulose-uronate ketol-isomerase
VYTDIDRSIVGSAVPVKKTLKLEAGKKEMAAEYFNERRETGIINIGGDGVVVADGTEYRLAPSDGLYVGRGTRNIEFKSTDSAVPAMFYFVSFPAHTAHPTVHTKQSEVEASRLGSASEANRRTIYRYVHPRGIRSCQLVMGLTVLEDGSVWNTMPVHTHQRRSEIYLYFGLSPDAAVVHLLGEPTETRHIIVRDRQAVISPSWSIHSGVATRNYSFIWGMGGENQVFEDMDGVPMETLR